MKCVKDRVRWLREQGILSTLTGEADGTNLGRVLCDLSEEGASLIGEYFGLGTDPQTPNWNPRINSDTPAVKSVMLRGGEIRRFALFAMMKNAEGNEVFAHKQPAGGNWVWYYDDGDTTEEEWDKLEETRERAEDRTIYYIYGTAGTRNRHEFTGRVE